jgi:CBS domain-containing protein
MAAEIETPRATERMNTAEAREGPARLPTVEVTQTLLDGARLMRDRAVSTVIVVDGAGTPIGALRERDIVREAEFVAGAFNPSRVVLGLLVGVQERDLELARKVIHHLAFTSIETCMSRGSGMTLLPAPRSRGVADS